MRNKTVSRFTMASFIGIGVVALAFACDDTTPTPTPVDMAVIPDLTMPPDLMPPTPTATAITPAMGPSAGGTAVTITGTNFKAGATVTIGGVAATQVTVVDATKITAMTAASTNFGQVDVTVDNKDGSSAAILSKGFRYTIATPAFMAANANIAVMSVNGPRSIALIDIVGQGYPSIITAMNTANSASTPALPGLNVLPNTTGAPTANAPTFVATQGIPTTGTNVFQTAIGDMDGNGQMDVVATNFAPNTVTVVQRMAAGNPTLVQIAMTTGSFSGPSYVVVDDFDKDGKVNDIAVTNQTSATVSVLKNNGNGNYAAVAGSPFNMTTGATGYIPFGLASGDFDGDGRPDLVVGNVGNNAFLRVILNKVAGAALQSPIATSTTPMQNIVKVGDFDGDGKLDFISVARQATGIVTFYKGDGAGGFTKGATTVNVGSNPEAAAVGDLNQDGILDLVVPNLGSTNLHWMTGKGDGTFNAPTMINTGVQTNDVAIADFNKDGRPDIAITGFNTGNVIIYRGTGN